MGYLPCRILGLVQYLPLPAPAPPGSLVLPSSTHKRFYPQRPSGQGTSRGHRCHPFSPVRAFIYFAHTVHYPHFSSVCIEFRRMRTLPISARQFSKKGYLARFELTTMTSEFTRVSAVFFNSVTDHFIQVLDWMRPSAPAEGPHLWIHTRAEGAFG